MRRSSVANGLGSLSKVATDMPQHPSSSAVNGPPASTPVSGLPTSSSRQSSRIEAKPRRASMILMPSALLWGIVSENHIWKSARRCSRSASGLEDGLVIFYSYSRSASSLSHSHIASEALSARVIAGGEGGARAKRGRVRWAAALAPETSRAYRPPPHLPIASQWGPSSPPRRGGEDPERTVNPTGCAFQSKVSP